jgi:hypothetical protein
MLCMTLVHYSDVSQSCVFCVLFPTEEILLSPSSFCVPWPLAIEAAGKRIPNPSQD